MSKMTNILLHGCGGAMGQVISELAAGSENVRIVAGVDVNPVKDREYPVLASLDAWEGGPAVVVDFSTAAAVDHLLDCCAEKGLPLVLCTTGLSDAQVRKAEACAQKTAVLRSANMSLGVNLLLKLVQDAARVLADAGFDMEIVEKHHRRKLDAPSGTALALADSLNEALGGEYHDQFDRHERHEKRDPKEIGISSVRGGTIVGEHEVIFAGQDEVVTFTHTAYSRAIFAKGALEAAVFLDGKPAGLYSMADVIAARTSR